MKTSRWSALLLCLLISTLGAVAADKHGDGEKRGGKQAAKVPERTEDVFSQLQNNTAELRSAIASKKARDVHEHAAAVKRLANALSNRATGDKKAMNAATQDLINAANRAHERAHDEKWGEAKEAGERADAALKRVEQAYKR